MTLRRLFTYAGTTQASPLGGGVQLALNPSSAIEISGDTATVNLAPSALSLNNQERYVISRAIANTLTQWGDIRYVNVLINSRQLGLDTASTIPLSSLGKTEDGDVIALYDSLNQSAARQDSAYTAMATLYYPISAGRGIAGQSRLMTASSRSLPDMAYALLEALSTRGDVPAGTPVVPDLTTLLQGPITVDENAGATGRIVKLVFAESMNEALIASGITRSVMMAALTYTLTTFLPYTSGISVTIGTEQITALVPAGLFDGAGEQILFTNGIMQRSQFASFRRVADSPEISHSSVAVLLRLFQFSLKLAVGIFLPQNRLIHCANGIEQTFRHGLPVFPAATHDPCFLLIEVLQLADQSRRLGSEIILPFAEGRRCPAKGARKRLRQ